MSGGRDAEYTEYVTARLSSLRRLAAVLCDDWQRADDLVQATLVKLYARWGRVRAATHPDAYARAVLVHEFIHERRSGWAKRVSLSGRVADSPAATIDQDAVLDLRAAVAALPDRQCAGRSGPPLPPVPASPPCRRSTRPTQEATAMIESQVRALFAEIADGEPALSQVDVQFTRIRGRARLRWRRTCVAGTSVLAAAAVVAFAVFVMGPARPASVPPAAGPPAPRQFNPLVPYLSFGWLPAGNSLLAGDVRPEVVGLTAGRTLDSPRTWNLFAYAAGQCHLTHSGKQLKCSNAALEGASAQITGPAPAIRGHRAFWTGSSLFWQYARGGWAGLGLPYPYYYTKLSTPAQREAIRRNAVKIADHARFGAPSPPLRFSVQLTGLPHQWRVSSVYYLPDAGVLRVSRFALGTGTPDLGADGGLEYQTNVPYFSSIDPVALRKGSCYRAPHKSTVETINGHRVVLTRGTLGSIPRQDLCAAPADGLSLYVTVFGAHSPINLTGLFRDHLRLLGTNPENWTTKPIG